MSLRKLDALFTVAILLVFALALWQARGWDLQTGLFPWVIGSVMTVLTLAQLGLLLRGQDQTQSAMLATADYDLPPDVVRRRTAWTMLWIAGFVVTIWLLGFPIAVPLLTLAYLRFGAREGWPLSVGLAAATGILFYFVFVRTLSIFFERGVLLRLLGL
jgi:hypothetical protein